MTELLGEGGMGYVHLAHQRSLGREVAVKTLKSGDEVAAAALLSEGRVTGRLEHPGIIPVHALGVDDQGRPVLVMKRVEGISWRDLLADPAHPEWKERGGSDRLLAHVEILMEVCNAAHFAHSRGVIHRDIKPENVMLGRFGEVYLVDWGIASAASRDDAEPLPLAGTPAYMAPEMAEGKRVDARTDVYLLGATLHEVLTGRPLHGGATVTDAIHSALRSDPPVWHHSVPTHLARVASRAVRRDRAERFTSAREMRDALADHLRHRASYALSDSAGACLADVAELLARSGDELAPDELPRLNRLTTECRFGMLQALEQWDGNETARAGLQSCLEAIVEIQIRRGDAEAARALLPDLPQARPALAERVAALERGKEAQRKQDEELRRRARELDPSTASATRVVALVLLGLVGVVMSVVTMHRPWLRELTPARLVVVTACMLVTTSVAIALARKRILTTEFNRRGVALLFVSLAALLVDRLLGLYFDAPIERIVLHDLTLLAVCCAAGALAMARWWWLAVGVVLLGSVAVLAAPEHAALSFSLTTVAMVLVPIWFWGRR